MGRVYIAQADTAEPLGVRDRAILETLYSTGVRRMELVGLGLCDLDLDRTASKQIAESETPSADDLLATLEAEFIEERE